jgi:acyl-CoA reductase-like NAD-dependent aldehyde dehydrogenase
MAKIASGLLTGNSVIIKPSPFTPYSVLKFVQLVQPVLPPGVLQSLNGDEKLGPWIVSHPGIPKITFTGSTTTGKKIMETGAKQLKRITLELGGNDACIVCPDIDISKVAPQVALGAFFNSGQLCVASKRIYVHQDIYEEFLKAMVEVVGGWKVGKATAEGVMLGPVQNEMQYEIVKGYFEDSIKRGLKFVLGGEVKASDSLVIQPAIIDNPPNDSLVVTGEAFGKTILAQNFTFQTH